MHGAFGIHRVERLQPAPQLPMVGFRGGAGLAARRILFDQHDEAVGFGAQPVMKDKGIGAVRQRARQAGRIAAQSVERFAHRRRDLRQAGHRAFHDPLRAFALRADGVALSVIELARGGKSCLQQAADQFRRVLGAPAAGAQFLGDHAQCAARIAQPPAFQRGVEPHDAHIGVDRLDRLEILGHVEETLADRGDHGARTLAGLGEGVDQRHGAGDVLLDLMQEQTAMAVAEGLFGLAQQTVGVLRKTAQIGRHRIDLADIIGGGVIELALLQAAAGQFETGGVVGR